MPFYEYQCSQCGKTFTRQESFEEHDRRRKVKCQECGSAKTRRLVAVPHVQTSKKS